MADVTANGPSQPLYGGEHACLLYRGRPEYIDALVHALETALERNQRVLWIRREPDTGPVQEVLRRIETPEGGDRSGREEGPRDGSLQILDISFSLSSTGQLDRSGLIQKLREETVRALDDGHSGVQVIQEMDGLLNAVRDETPIKRYETALSTFLPGSPCSVLCIYDRACCAPDQLLTLLEVHPQAMVGGEVSENIYAIPPEDLLELDLPRATLRRRLKNLAEHREAEKARRMHTTLVELLHEVARAGHQATTDDELVHTVLARVCHHLGWSAGHYYRLDEDVGELVPSGLWYLEDAERFADLRSVTEGTRFRVGSGLPGTVAADREPLWLSDVRESEHVQRTRSGEVTGIRSAFATPVLTDDTLLGVFEFFSEVHREPDPELLDVVTEVGSQLGEVLERKEAERELLLLEAAVRHLEEAVLVLSPEFSAEEGPRVVYANPAIEEITGYRPEEVTGRRTDLLFGPKTDQIVRRRSRRELSEGGAVSGEVIAYRKDGSEFVLQWHMSPVRNGDDRVTHIVAVYRDVTDARRAEEAIRRADHDSLTGLPNRDLFTRRLERSVERVRKDPSERFAVLFLDLDRFKVVNDSLGHLRGDQLLVALARRLERTVRPDDTVARFGGDEFVILLDRVDDLADVTAVARRIEQELESPFAIGGRSVYTTASIGIALSDTGYTLPEDVLRDADSAMYRAKSSGGGTYEVFDQTLYDDAVSVLRLETELHHAVDRSDFQLLYQPIVSLEDGRTRGFEALLRWAHPERGLLKPTEFLGLAEETGLIVPIGHWVLDEAGRQLQSWQDRFEAATHLSLSVNLSAREFGTDQVVSTIRKVMRDHSLFTGSLQVEITENALVDRPERVEKILRELMDMGVRICLDDFGTGYSSLSYLHRFPVKILKIDRLFVERLTTEGDTPARNEEIVRAILALAQNLDLEVTAEGVENRSQLSRLRRMKCHHGQGYYFSRPLTAAEVEELFRESAGDGDGNGSGVPGPP